MRTEYRDENHELTVNGVNFILLRKNASTSVSAAVYKAMGFKTRVRHELPVRLNIAVWRDPVGRAWSAWRHLRRGLDIEGFRGLDWPEFVSALCERPDEDLDIHLRSQASVIRGRSVYWLHHDRLDADWVDLIGFLPWIAGLRFGPLEHLNGEKADPAPHSDALRERFACDYEFQRREDVESRRRVIGRV